MEVTTAGLSLLGGDLSGVEEIESLRDWITFSAMSVGD